MVYIVKKGDTLYGLYGPNWKQLSGYTGDPTKLPIGTQLPDLPGTVPSPATTPPVVAPPAGEQPITKESDFGQVVLDAINKYVASIQGQAPISEAYTKYKESLGIPGMETTQLGLTKQVTDVEGLLDKLESDINARASAIGGVATEAQLRRRQAAEAKPLREQLADLYRSQTTGQAGLTSARQELAAMMSLEQAARGEQKENILGLLPYYQQALAKPELPKAPTTMQTAEGIMQWNPQTGQWEKTGYVPYQAPKTTTEKVTDSDRISVVGDFINSRREVDKLISANDYIEAQRQWIGMGGTVADFKAAFPPESVMGSWELPKLPSSIWKSPSGGGSSNEDIAG